MFPLTPSLRSSQEEVLQPFMTKTLNQKLSVTHNLTGYTCSLDRKPLVVRELTSISQLNSEPRLAGKRASVLTHSARLPNGKQSSGRLGRPEYNCFFRQIDSRADRLL